MGVMSLSQNMIGVMQAADFNSQIQDEMFIGRVNLSKEYNCTANFKDAVVGDKLSSDQMKLRLAKSKTNLTLSKSYILPSQDPNNNSSKMTVSAVELKAYPGSDNLALLAITFEAKNTSLTGGHTRTREIPLEIVQTGGKISKCSAAGVSLSTEEEDEVDSLKRQGTACSGVPSSMKSDIGEKQNIDTADIKEVLNSLCDAQTYPVTKGMAVTVAEYKKICKTSAKACQAAQFIYCAEMSTWDCLDNKGNLDYAAIRYNEGRGDLNDVTLKTRNGYKDAAACKAQKAFSEGDRVGQALCINGVWARLPKDTDAGEPGRGYGSQ